MVAVGNRIGDYEVLAKLGEGGMATLFLARRVGISGFSRPVAIKVVHSRLNEDPDFVNMFIDEANISSRIVHPNVVHVEELGKTDEHYFLVMEYIDGCSLSQLVRTLKRANRRLNSTSAVSIVAAVAAALDAAHKTTGEDGLPLGIVHRDVSPQNILMSYQGHTKLIDFGIAKARGRLAETQTTAIKGKLRYMAPEQARGASVDGRTDVYALGIILWELLTGRRLFAGQDNLEVLAQAGARTIEPPHEINPNISAELSAAVMKAMETSPNARPQSAREWRSQLLEAEPSARSVDPMVVSHFLRDMMSELIDQQREKFGSISGVTTAAFQDSERHDPTGAHQISVERATETLTDPVLSDGATLPTAVSPRRVVSGKTKLALAAMGICLAAIAGVMLSGYATDEEATVVNEPTEPAGLAPTPAVTAVPVRLAPVAREPAEVDAGTDTQSLEPAEMARRMTQRMRPARMRPTEMNPPDTEMTAVSMQAPTGSIVSDFDL
ncbi:MAG: serine/threonine protein kinase [Polyangiales bacterium]|jgi:serine/threonine protein kinase